MASASTLDVLLSLLGTTEQDPLGGDALAGRLAAAARAPRADRLLATLLELEASGHVWVQRSPSYSFALTERGEQAAYELGPGTSTDVVLVMVDLVGFTAFTAAHGDPAAHRTAQQLTQVGDEELRRHRGGRVVKSLGDGLLGVLEPGVDAPGVIGRIAGRCQQPSGERWPLRAAAHRGRPIQHQGDLYGADVNLVARLCAAAGPDELLVTRPDGDGLDDGQAGGVETIAIRGLDHRIPVERRSLVV